jgi:hypothetical protein
MDPAGLSWLMWFAGAARLNSSVEENDSLIAAKAKLSEAGEGA